MTPGTHSLTAHYSGDAENKLSISSVLFQSVTGATHIQVTASSGSVQQALSIPVTIE